MDSEYVVEVEVTGFVTEDTRDLNGEPITTKDAAKLNKDKLKAFANLPDVEPVEALIREDGTGILYFRWTPPAEPSRDDTGAQTWMAAKRYTENVLSAVAGAGFAKIEHRIGTWAG